MSSINVEALFKACCTGDAAAVSRLLPAGGTPRNLSGLLFQSPDLLIAAAANGHTEIVRMMLDRVRNTTVNDANETGLTAHIIAAQYHDADMVRVLADRGANVNLTTRKGYTALCLAVAPIYPPDPPRAPDPGGSRQVATVKALLRLGAGKLPARAPPQPFHITTSPPDPCACYGVYYLSTHAF